MASLVGSGPGVTVSHLVAPGAERPRHRDAWEARPVSAPDHPIRRALLRRPSATGVVVGLVFWWFSLVPSLLPRSWTVQAAVSAICVGIGYSIGALVRWAVRRARRGKPPLRSPLAGRLPEQVPTWVVPAGATAVLVGVGCAMWVRWQDQQRLLVDMAPVTAASVVPMVLVTAVLTGVLGLLGRLVGGAVRRLDRWNRRHLPGALALPTTIVLVVLVATFLGRDVAATQMRAWANRTFSAADQDTAAGTERPTAPTVSGSPDSLVAWDDLGFQGREFVAHATRADELEAFAREVGADPDDVVAPVRAYAGLQSADDVEERAQLAVDELVRAGGFDREVLVVATSTGTGWIDPDASRALEIMHGGDTAIVSMQYSYLPSWIAFVTELGTASEAGAELYAAVHDEWESRPANDRPRLISFGLSLGSFGAAGAFAGEGATTSVDNITTRSEGALFVGTPYATTILRQLVDDRDGGSPPWAPVVDDGREVRFVTRDPSQRQPDGPWDEPHVLFVQHPSDPVVHWYYSWLWRQPEWMAEPRGYDVPAEAGWFPIVTGVQGVFDLMAGFSAPPGFGHDYALDYPKAWGDVAPPEGWTAADSVTLERFVAERRAAEADADEGSSDSGGG